jgi:copper chaperone NosL
MGIIAVVALSIIFFPSASAGTGPVPIAHGRDACARCRMHIGEPGFAGEMRDVKGELTKYDDVGCLLIAMWKKHREVPGIWVEAHDSHRMVPLLRASLVVDSSVRTPMGYGIIAFEEPSRAADFAAKNRGTVRTLEDVLKDEERFR